MMNTPAIISDGLAPNRPTSRPRQGREDECATGDGQKHQPGVDCREPALPLQIQRHHEQKRAPQRERAYRDSRRRREGDAAEESQVDERVEAA